MRGEECDLGFIWSALELSFRIPRMSVNMLNMSVLSPITIPSGSPLLPILHVPYLKVGGYGDILQRQKGRRSGGVVEAKDSDVGVPEYSSDHGEMDPSDV